MNVIHAIVLGVVEGLTEFLPISSTAHMELAAKLLGLAESDFVKTFEIVIQFGAILAVVFIYFNLLRRNWEIWKRIIVAFIPTAAIGFVLYKIIKNTFLGNYSILVWTLGIGGIILILCEYIYSNPTSPDYISSKKAHEQELATMSYSKAFIIGLVQSLAVVPGVSRSGATIVSGLVMGISRQAIVEFSFLLAVPTVAAASGYELLKSASSLQGSSASVLIVGFIAAFIFALIAIKAFLAVVKNRSLAFFGIYRIVLAIALYLYLIKMK